MTSLPTVMTATTSAPTTGTVRNIIREDDLGEYFPHVRQTSNVRFSVNNASHSQFPAGPATFTLSYPTVYHPGATRLHFPPRSPGLNHGMGSGTYDSYPRIAVGGPTATNPNFQTMGATLMPQDYNVPLAVWNGFQEFLQNAPKLNLCPKYCGKDHEDPKTFI